MKTQTDYVNQLRDDLMRLERRNRELERQLAEAINGNLPKDEHLDPEMIQVESMVSSQTKEPVVVIRWFTHLAQMPAQSARDLALNLLDVAEAAKSDSYIWQFFKELGAADQQIGQMILEFRNFRMRTPKEL